MSSAMLGAGLSFPRMRLPSEKVNTKAAEQDSLELAVMGE